MQFTTMRRVILFLLIILPIGVANAQKMHTTLEIYKKMEESKITYDARVIDSVFECPDRSEKVVAHDYYQVFQDSTIYLRRIPRIKQSADYFDRAEDYFGKQELDSAMKYYYLAIAADSLQFTSMTYIGQIHEIRRNYDSAFYWYNKVISLNFIDYMAHWFLADLYQRRNEIDKACEEIVIAQILNRNNPRLKASLDQIFFKAKRVNENWCFQPEVVLTKTSDKDVQIGFTPKWMGYAMAKALWDFEPGYRESMGASDSNFSLLEYKECLATQLSAMQASKAEFKSEAPFKYLWESVWKNMLDEFIIYEILLPQYPLAASNFPPEAINKIKDYVLEIRNKK